MNWEAIDISILGPALLAGILVTTTHVPLGQRVLERGIIFLDLAVAQFAGLGIIAAHTLHWESYGWPTQIVAMLAAIVGVLILNHTEKRWPQYQEAFIGSSFVLASSISILLLASDPHGGEQLKELLVGQILWVSYAQLIPVAILYAIVLAIWYKFARHAAPIYFYLLFAITITASIQLIGVYLVFASLILPALATRYKQRSSTGYGYLISVLGYVFGLILAALLDMPAGAMIVVTLAVCALALGYIASSHKNKNPKP